MQTVKKITSVSLLSMVLMSLFSFSTAKAFEWDNSWGYNGSQSDLYDDQLNYGYDYTNYSDYNLSSSPLYGSNGWDSSISSSSYDYSDYYNNDYINGDVYSQDYTNQYPYSNWDFANEDNWSNDDYWLNQGDWNNWYVNQRDGWRNYYQANVQNRDYHPINISYYDRDDRYSVLTDDNDYRRRIIWANRDYPIGRFMDYPDSWYNSWRNWQRNYARGVAIRDRNNFDNVIIIANANDISGRGNVINIERATVVVDSDLFNQICSMVDLNDGRNYDFRFNRYNNTLGYNVDGNWQSCSANYSYY